ncbi:MAG: type II toxin-antitoxin system RelE/ParE family toxin [Chitinophagales bacterium]|nr:type II toxin-antitoxin system RelE/ParE family toxin [Chitinophagales bacterium]
MVKIVWTDEAMKNMLDIHDYIVHRGSKFYAAQTLRKIKSHVKVLSKYIRIGKIVPEFNAENIRELIEGNYRIVYRVKDDELAEIISVYHSYRDMNKLNVK